jgi:serine/threonine-protein kinase
MIGEILGHYRILDKLGAGGMGEVYRAHDERLDRDVALKVLPAGLLADESARHRFRKEALALAKLNHPNIEAVYDFDTQAGVDFLVMEYVPGATLSDKLALGPLAEKEILGLGGQLAEGLAAAHEQGVVHRDLKPGNLSVTRDGRLKILDFGLAKLVRPVSDADVTASLTETKAVAGTLPYMAPEQLRGEPVDARTDIYAAGVVLYEMATGRLPFGEKVTTALTDAILHQPPVTPRALNARVSPGLERIVLKCLDKDPESRYQSAKELGVDLRRLAVPTTVPISPRREPRGWGRLSGRGLLAGAAVVVLLAVLFALNVGGLRERLLGRAAAPRIESLAVLPLENLSRDPEQEYFVDGMTEALITDLSKISALRVISRTSVMQYKGVKKALPEIARELKVDAVVEGSVLRVGDRVRITAQLIRAVPEEHLWANSYDRELRDILALHSEVAQAVAAEVRAKLTPDERARLASARPVNPEAYEGYLKGRYYWNKRTEESLKKGISYFQEAIQKDPSYSLAYVGLADSYVVLHGWGFLPAEEAYPKARAAARKALEIDDTLGEAYASLAAVALEYDWDWATAGRQYRRALELNPSYASAHQWYAEYLARAGRHGEAIAEVKRAQELDPLSLIISAVGAYVFYFARQYDQAIEQSRKTLELDPNFAPAHLYRGWSYEGKQMHREAIADLQEAVALSGNSAFTKAALGGVYAAAGQRGEALKVVEELTERSKRSYVSPYYLALIYASLGEKEEALAWLEEAYKKHDSVLLHLKVDPRIDPLRADPRFQDLLRRMNFLP